MSVLPMKSFTEVKVKESDPIPHARKLLDKYPRLGAGYFEFDREIFIVAIARRLTAKPMFGAYRISDAAEKWALNSVLPHVTTNDALEALEAQVTAWAKMNNVLLNPVELDSEWALKMIAVYLHPENMEFYKIGVFNPKEIEVLKESKVDFDIISTILHAS